MVNAGTYPEIHQRGDGNFKKVKIGQNKQTNPKKKLFVELERDGYIH